MRTEHETQTWVRMYKLVCPFQTSYGVKGDFLIHNWLKSKSSQYWGQVPTLKHFPPFTFPPLDGASKSRSGKQVPTESLHICPLEGASKNFLCKNIAWLEIPKKIMNGSLIRTFKHQFENPLKNFDKDSQKCKM